MWNSEINGFKIYLKLEKGLSQNTLSAYLHDIDLLREFFITTNRQPSLNELKLRDLEQFIKHLYDIGLNERSQARIISGIKAFFKYLILEKIISNDPSDLLESPKLAKKLPETLSHEEIEKMIATLDLSKPHNVRNKAIIEVMYSCGLRVSEATALTISGLLFDMEIIRIVGKGSKERLVPIGQSATKNILIYKNEIRNHLNIHNKHTDILFLNKNGKPLSRIMLFKIIKEMAAQAGITKTVSPHTLRHSFATEMINNGANLRAIQLMLGHASITTTEIYTHLDQQYLRDTLIQYHPRF
jgi:integrase/recombinase XerD